MKHLRKLIREWGDSMKELNVIDIIPKERHPLIFSTFDGLEKDEAFILTNDHDPN